MFSCTHLFLVFIAVLLALNLIRFVFLSKEVDRLKTIILNQKDLIQHIRALSKI